MALTSSYPRLRIHPLLFLFLTVYFAAGMIERAAAAFAALLAHEAGHLIAGRRLGAVTGRIELLPFGGITYVENVNALSLTGQIAFALAGPATNLLLFCAGLGLVRYGYLTGKTGQFFLTVNLLLAAFNLLPGLPLDGGRVLAAFLSRKKGLYRATYLGARLGQLTGLLTFAGGVLGPLSGRWGLDVAGVGLFLIWAATRELRFAPYLFLRQLLAKEREFAAARVLPGAVLVALEEARLLDVAHLFRPGSFSFVVVTDYRGEWKGVLSESAVIRALTTGGGSVKVGTILPAATQNERPRV